MSFKVNARLGECYLISVDNQPPLAEGGAEIEDEGVNGHDSIGRENRNFV